VGQRPVYYLLIPRYAGRPLVAGNVVAVAWVIAVVVNVAIWAHDIYLDRVRNGKGAMPAFDERLSDRQIADVAAFVAESAGR
jgi:mono/diheme cytochrome c family protein